MEIAIPKSLEALVRRKVEEGHYSTEAEVVADALRLMQVRDEVAAVKRERLKDALDRGYEDVAAEQTDSAEDVGLELADPPLDVRPPFTAATVASRYCSAT